MNSRFDEDRKFFLEMVNDLTSEAVAEGIRR